jgi:hypothetical protein
MQRLQVEELALVEAQRQALQSLKESIAIDLRFLLNAPTFQAFYAELPKKKKTSYYSPPLPQPPEQFSAWQIYTIDKPLYISDYRTEMELSCQFCRCNESFCLCRQAVSMFPPHQEAPNWCQNAFNLDLDIDRSHIPGHKMMCGFHRGKGHVANIGVGRGWIKITDRKGQRWSAFGFEHKFGILGGNALNTDHLNVFVNICPPGDVCEYRP